MDRNNPSAFHKLMANFVMGAVLLYQLSEWSTKFSPGTAYPCKFFLCSQTNYNSANGTLVKAQCNAAGKWLLLLSNSWTDITLLLQYCWLITMISHSAWFTSYPSISYQCIPQQNFPALVQLVMARCSLIMAKCHSVIRSLVAEFYKYLWKLLSNRWNCL